MNKGDIVNLANRSGLWVFAGDSPAEISSRAIGKFLRATNIYPRDPHESITMLGHKQTFAVQSPKADMCGALAHVCFVPKADIRYSSKP